MKIAIINYDAGNVKSLQFAIERLGQKAILTDDPFVIKEADKIIFPGQGEASNAMDKLRKHNLDKIIPSLKQPILGICLGHQAIGMSFGGNIVQSKSIVHGKVSTINIYPSKIFNNTDKQIRVVRYHSLVIDNLNFPPSLTVTANLENGTIMGLEHVKYPVFGIQFHPESIDTEFGKKIIKNFLEL